MTAWSRRCLLVLACAVAGAIGFAFAGSRPDPGEGAGSGRVDWSLPTGARMELAAADGVWKTRPPWGALPADASAAPAPRYVPVGIVGAGASLYAVFAAPGLPEAHVRAGDRLPDGGRVTRISRLHLSWIDAQGDKHEHELLADPLPMPMNMP